MYDAKNVILVISVALGTIEANFLVRFALVAVLIILSFILEEKKMKKLLSVISLCLVLVMLTSALASCSNRSKLVGTWQEAYEDGEFVSNGEVLVFANDGTGSVSSDGLSGSLTWSVDGDTLFMTVSVCGTTTIEECKYKISGNILTLTFSDGEVTTYRKR